MPEAKKPAPAGRDQKPAATSAKRSDGLRRAANKAKATATPRKSYDFPVKPPTLAPGVVPDGVQAPVLATDANPYAFAAEAFPGGGFPGFSYLSQLATRAEYRQMASGMSTELTREWIEFTSKQDDDTDTAGIAPRQRGAWIETTVNYTVKDEGREASPPGNGGVD